MLDNVTASLKLYAEGQPRTKHKAPCWMLHQNLQVLTAAVDESGNGWQGDFLERWGHDGNRRLIHPGLCNNNPAVTITQQAKSPGQKTAKLSATVICASRTLYTSLGNQCCQKGFKQCGGEQPAHQCSGKAALHQIFPTGSSTYSFLPQCGCCSEK